MTVEKPKVITPTNHNRTNSAMNQSQFLAITFNSPEAREKSRVHVAIGFQVLHLIGWETGVSLLSQSLSVAIAIT